MENALEENSQNYLKMLPLGSGLGLRGVVVKKDCHFMCI